MIADPASERVEAELNSAGFRAGVESGRWRMIAWAFPILDVAIAATEPDGSSSEYGFRIDLANFPSQPPMARIWDHEANAPLPADRRPKGNQRVTKAFQHWGDDTVYRPWDRRTGPHISNSAQLAHLGWRIDRKLTFILEDLHATLNLNARAHRLRPAA